MWSVAFVWTVVIGVYLANGRQGTLDVGAANQVGWDATIFPNLRVNIIFSSNLCVNVFFFFTLFWKGVGHPEVGKPMSHST